MTDIEFELKKRFAELRAADEVSGPSFAEVRDKRSIGSVRDRAANSGKRWIGPGLIAAAAAVIAVVWSAARGHTQRTRRETPPLDSSTMVIRWNMPTDGLLESARQTLRTPALSASVLDGAGAPIPGTPFKGD
ncbi:MAG TPA: hypothetical protein VI259_06175 [Gemmatimonadaceae bacterium]